MDFEVLKKTLIESAKELGIAEYEIYYSSRAGMSAETLGREISSLTSSTSGGLCFRCLVNGSMGYASTELMEESEMRELVRRAAVNAENTEKEDKVGIFGGSERYGKTNSQKYIPLSAEQIKKTALSIQDENYAVSDKVTDGTQSAVETEEMTVRIVNSHGLELENTSGVNIVYSAAVVLDRGEHQDDYAFEEYGKITDKELAEKAVNGALENIGAQSVDTGKYNIVISAKQMRTILSVFSDAFSAKTAQSGMSLLAGKEGERIAADIINITDDPMREGVSVQTPFDAEGVAAYRKDVVKDGVLLTLLHNRETALRAGRETTANASKGAYFSPVNVSPYAFCIEAGSNTLDELFALAGEGIYITEVKGLHAGANSVTGDFSIESAGFIIKDGKKAFPVRSFTIAGNFFDMLKNISALSDKVEVGLGGPTVFGSPAVLIREMSVAGK